MHCPRCQEDLKENARFCSGCGLSMDSLDNPTEQMPSEAKVVYNLADDTLLGQTLDGKYEIIARIGTGGMGIVYRAHRLHIGDEVAVKIMAAKYLDSSSAIERFRREARAAAKLQHPNIVAIHDFNEPHTADIPAYIVMEFLNGLSLRDLLHQEGKLEFHRAMNLMKQICAGVGAAHRHNIVHRDLKPDNIIILPADSNREYETVKVVDFGIAKLRDQSEELTLTQTGAALGTPFYMSPEQCRGESPDIRSDVYSLGAMMYEMIVGHPPFVGSSPHVVAAKHLTEEMSPFPEKMDLPFAFEYVIRRALSKDPQARQSNADIFSLEFLSVAGKVQTAQQDAKPSQDSKKSFEYSTLLEDAETKHFFAVTTGEQQFEVDQTEVISPINSYDETVLETEVESEQEEIVSSDEHHANSHQTSADSMLVQRPSFIQQLKNHWKSIIFPPVILIVFLASLLFIFYAINYLFFSKSGFDLIIEGAPPNSRVFIDGIEKSTTTSSPRTAYIIRDLKAGVRNIRVTCNGYADFNGTVRGEDGEEKRMFITLTSVMRNDTRNYEPYSQMSEKEKNQFILSEAERISRQINPPKGYVIPSDVIEIIRKRVDLYSQRSQIPTTKNCKDNKCCFEKNNLSSVYENGKNNAAVITKSFERNGVQPLLGIYLAMVQTEYCSCFYDTETSAKGIFRIIGPVAELYGLKVIYEDNKPDDRCNVEFVSNAAAKYLKDRLSENRKSPLSNLLALTFYEMSPSSTKAEILKLLSTSSNSDKAQQTFWKLVFNAYKDEKENAKTREFPGLAIIPKFFAAAIVGENPRLFGVDMEPLSSYTLENQ